MRPNEFPQRQEKNSGNVLLTLLGDPHFYLMLVILGIMLAMTIVSCAHHDTNIERLERTFETQKRRNL